MVIAADAKKYCHQCDDWLPRCAFNKDRRSPDGRHFECGKCAKRRRDACEAANPEKYKQTKIEWRKANPGYDRDNHLRTKFKITSVDYARLLEQQNGVCAVCERPETKKHRLGKVQLLSVDHDHKTGKVRGLVCADCNLALGHTDDSITRLKRLISYLKKHQNQ